jgi:hypothetical protein
MPTESLIVTIAVVAVFTLFSLVLLWAHHATEKKR